LSSLFLPFPSAMMLYLISGPETMDPTKHPLKPLKLWAKINLSSLKLVFSGFLKKILEVLWFELRALHLPGRHSYHLSHDFRPFDLVILERLTFCPSQSSLSFPPWLSWQIFSFEMASPRCLCLELCCSGSQRLK
jgi:hypothetical protein